MDRREALTVVGSLVGGSLISGSIIGGTLLTGMARTANAAEERHQHIHKAIEELREARRELKGAEHDFDGHREEAIKAVDFAIEQLELCARSKR